MKGRKFLLRYRPELSSLREIDKELWEFTHLEGHKEFILPEEGSRELFVSQQVALDNGGTFSYIISRVEPVDGGDYFISTVEIVDSSSNVSASQIFDYLSEHWFTREQLRSWLEGRGGLPTKA